MAQNWTDDVYNIGHTVDTDMQNVENNFNCIKSMFSGSSAPVNPADGQLWLDSGSSLIKVRYNSSWVPLIDIGTKRLSTQISIYDGAVTSSVIADAAVNSSKLASSAVTEVKLADGAVAAAKIADGGVGYGKITALSSGAVYRNMYLGTTDGSSFFANVSTTSTWTLAGSFYMPHSGSVRTIITVSKSLGSTLGVRIDVNGVTTVTYEVPAGGGYLDITNDINLTTAASGNTINVYGRARYDQTIQFHCMQIWTGNIPAHVYLYYTMRNGYLYRWAGSTN